MRRSWLNECDTIGGEMASDFSVVNAYFSKKVWDKSGEDETVEIPVRNVVGNVGL